jgi:hypothetical protein
VTAKSGLSEVSVRWMTRFVGAFIGMCLIGVAPLSADKTTDAPTPCEMPETGCANTWLVRLEAPENVRYTTRAPVAEQTLPGMPPKHRTPPPAQRRNAISQEETPTP